jgi:hypothetical protein
MVRLSTLTSLQELMLAVDTEAGLIAEAVAAVAWHALPLRLLHLRSSRVIEACVVQGLSQLQCLKTLVLVNHLSGAGSLAATHKQMGLVLRQLPGLQELVLQASRVHFAVHLVVMIQSHLLMWRALQSCCRQSVTCMS